MTLLLDAHKQKTCVVWLNPMWQQIFKRLKKRKSDRNASVMK